MNNILSGTLSCLCVVNISLHSAACYLLLCLYKNDNRNLQLLYLINLSFSEIVMNCIAVTCRALGFFTAIDNMNEFLKYLSITYFAGNTIVFYLNISYLNFHCLFKVTRDIRYVTNWSQQKAKYLIACTWLVGVFAVVLFSLSYKLKGMDYYHVLFTYFFPTVNSAIIIITILTYYCIYHESKESSVMPIQNRRHHVLRTIDKPAITRTSVYRHSRFHIPILVVTSFLVLKVIPDLSVQVIGYGNDLGIEVMVNVCWISYALSGIASGYIYLFVQQPAKALLCKIINKSRLKRQNCVYRRRRKLGITLTKPPHTINTNIGNLVLSIHDNYFEWTKKESRNTIVSQACSKSSLVSV